MLLSKFDKPLLFILSKNINPTCVIREPMISINIVINGAFLR